MVNLVIEVGFKMIFYFKLFVKVCGIVVYMYMSILFEVDVFDVEKVMWYFYVGVFKYLCVIMVFSYFNVVSYDRV